MKRLLISYLNNLAKESGSNQLDYARYSTEQVQLKGDIPIGVAPHSVDVWAEPHLFNTAMSAGAPPDAFAEEGQNWGFPTYNWAKMKEDGYAWWKNWGFPTYNWAKMKEDGYAWWKDRLDYLGNIFSAYRIDHILGFFLCLCSKAIGRENFQISLLMN